MHSFDLTYDYRCPFAKNIHLHAVTALRAGAPLDITFVPWTMSQGHRAEGATDVWDDPRYDAAHFALAASISVRDQQPLFFLDVHEQLFRARHERGRSLNSWEHITEVLTPLGVNVTAVEDDLASRRPHQVIAASYQRMAAYDAFGVPTFVSGDDATFVRYMTGPTDDPQHSVEVISSLVTLMTTKKDMNEFKHTRVAQ